MKDYNPDYIVQAERHQGFSYKVQLLKVIKGSLEKRREGLSMLLMLLIMVNYDRNEGNNC